MKKIEPRTLSGFMELLPNEQLMFNKVKKVIEETYLEYGFLPLDTPIIEASEVLLAKAGGETEKQIYQINREDHSMTLRFDLTVPLAKYVALYYPYLSFPFRRYQIGKVYRGERPQKGRFREFYQCDIDIIGDKELSIANDAEIPFIISQLFTRLGLNDFVIKINNRKILNGLFSYYQVQEKSADILRIIDKVLKIGKENVVMELKNLGLEEKIIQPILDIVLMKHSSQEMIHILQQLPISNELFQIGLAELKHVFQYAILFGVEQEKIAIDLSISRGLDYYTGTVYETYLTKNLELGSICSGGRYDNLAEYYTDHVLPGVGISIGLTRLFDKMLELNLIESDEVSFADVLLIPMTDQMEAIIPIYNQLRKENVKALVYYEKKSIKAMMNYATKLHMKYVMFIGDEEINKQMVTLKNIQTYEQKTISLEQAVEEILHG